MVCLLAASNKSDILNWSTRYFEANATISVSTPWMGIFFFFFDRLKTETKHYDNDRKTTSTAALRL
jgi:hypothetical protein